MSITNFPDSQTLSMQREALRRVREMQQRARLSVEEANASSTNSWTSAGFAQPLANEAVPQRSTPQPSYQQLPNQMSQTPQPVQAPPNSPSPGQQPPQADVPPAQFNPPQNRQQRQNNSQPNNILSHLFGGGRPPVNQGSQGGNRGPQLAPNVGQPRAQGGSGLLDLLRRQGLGDSVSGLGETLQSTISSVSEPLSNLLGSFGIDGEKLIILLVMWAIFNEHKENKTLLLALGYLLL